MPQRRRIIIGLVAGWLAVGLISSCGLAQRVDSSRSIRAQVDVGAWVGTARSQPFWLRANQYGTAPSNTPSATVRAAVWKEYSRSDTVHRRRSRLDWGFGLNPVVNAGAPSRVLLGEAYLKGKWGWLELLAGRWRQPIGLGDSTLSSGSVVVSDNALPIPKVQLATRGYVPFGFLRNWVAINAGYAHGWFNVPYIQGSYLHQKYLYWRFGKPTGLIRVHAGLNHQVQWGGRADYLIGSNVAVNGKLPSQFKYYDDVILAINPTAWDNDDFTSFDGAYRIGNHLGSMDLAVEISTRAGEWFLYHQHLYEDQSGLLWINAPDGLTGLSWSRSKPGSGVVQLNRVVVEVLSTLNQSGPTFDLVGARFQGNDNYYNHGQYREGWSYLGRSLGTPFVAPGGELVPRAQSGAFFPNNRVRMGYVGVSGRLFRSINWTSRLAYSRNYGTFSTPYAVPPGQFSGLIAAQAPIGNWPGVQLHVSLAVDQGKLLNNTVGGYIGLTRRW
ncbi:capsule assembly Wzi family protein [Larkinella insperata]|uniref:Capsule assembly Wzi family protein n=1 Tax=Larkinella insperata TaxID=332158 RepID=A0ABW3QKS7_9BACT|nr:capsule assembly Wzi family protein [Larkinella insperata]